MVPPPPNPQFTDGDIQFDVGRFVAAQQPEVVLRLVADVELLELVAEKHLVLVPHRTAGDVKSKLSL